jgi:hypothetical protein
MANWTCAASSDLAPLLITNTAIPPPLPGEAVSNSLAWTIAFAPILSEPIEFLLGALAETAAWNSWWVALLVNTGLCLLDERLLSNAGHDTRGMTPWAFLLVPVYLFARAAKLRHNSAYALVWIATFLISLALLGT